MKSILACAIALFAALVSMPSSATPPPYRQIVGSIGIFHVPDTNTLRGADWSATPNVTVTCYYTGADNCTGGGDFDMNTCPGSPTDNDATLIIDFAGHCFFRKNFGLNNVADARQCGIHAD